MFPIVPNHMLSSGRQRSGATTSTGTTSGTDRSGRSVWNVWSGAECKAKEMFKVQKKCQKPVRPSETATSTHNSAGIMINQGGFADVAIGKDTKSHDIAQMDALQVVSRRCSSPPMRFTVSSRGFLQCNVAETKVPEQIWIKQLRLAMDVHSNNTILETRTANDDGSSVSVYLRAIRNIDAGEELLLWFSEEILALIGIPFLTPANIRGECF